MDVVVFIEALKAALRLVLWRYSGERTVLAASNPLPEREVDPAELEAERRRRIDEILLEAEDERSLALLSASRQMEASVASITSAPGASGQDTSASLVSLSASTGSLPQGRKARWDSWRGLRTGLTRPTLRSLRPGAKEAAAAGLMRPLPPHPLAPGQQSHENGGVSSGGSDSDDTIVVDPEEEEEDLWASQQAQYAAGLPPTPGQQQNLASSSRTARWTDAQINNYLLSKTLAPTDVVKPQELVRPVQGNVGRFAEVLWILRPVIYGESKNRRCRLS